MANLVAAAVLIGLLFVSTMLWAVTQVRSAGEEQVAPQVMKARMWAAATPLVLLMVLVTASGIALFSERTSPLERLVTAATSPVVAVSLGLVAVLALYPTYLCRRAGRSAGTRPQERLHMALHMVMVYAVVLVLLALRGPAA
jgi:hypothetical protein